MAKPPMPSDPNTPQTIPQGYPQDKRTSPATTRTFGFDPVPPTKGNLGFGGLPPSDAFAENPDPAYRPFDNVRRGR